MIPKSLPEAEEEDNQQQQERDEQDQMRDAEGIEIQKSGDVAEMTEQEEKNACSKVKLKAIIRTGMQYLSGQKKTVYGIHLQGSHQAQHRCT